MRTRPGRVDGKVAVVTGAGSRGEGIGNGRATAILLAREGARVGLIDNVRAWAEKTQEMIADEGGTSMVLECDVSDPDSARRAIVEIDRAWRRWCTRAA